ncbi:MAG: bifunctional phosphoribosylaminoimidazolecarboxamide formyltransferase/IMP cyclohydrolase, partial [bacterium]
TQYPSFLAALEADGVDRDLRRQLALAAFRHTAAYDAAIAAWLTQRLEPSGCAAASEQPGASGSPATAAAPLTLALPPRQKLRYGENPHQQATWFGSATAGWGGAQQLQG